MSVKQIFNTSAELDYPKVLPTLDLDFANSKTLDPRITFTRASGGSYVGADGLIKYAGVNEPRFDHDPVTGESLGFLVEESRSNIRTTSILFDSGVSVALYGNWNYATTPSNTAAIAPDGTLTANRFRPVSPTGTLMQRFSATAGLTYTISMYLKLDPESPSNNLIQYFGFQVAWSNNGSTLTSYASSPSIGDQLTNEWKRFSFSYTLPAGATSMEMGPSNRDNGGGDPNYSVLAWGWQIEQGAFPTSYIPTEGSSRTRADDDAQITGKNFSSWYNQSEGTLLWKGIFDSYNSSGSNDALFAITDGTTNNRFSIRPRNTLATSSGNTLFQSFDWGYTVQSNTYMNGALAIKSGDYALVTSGVVRNTSSSSSVPQVNRIENFNSIEGGYTVTGVIHHQRITYYPKRLTNQQLQALTT